MLIGYAGDESEMKFTAAGMPVANFSLAVKEVYKNGDGSRTRPNLQAARWERRLCIVAEAG